MEVTMCCDTSEQTHCRPLCCNSVGYHYKHSVSAYRPIDTMIHVSVPSPFHLRSVRMVCIHTVSHVQSPSGTARDRRIAIISFKYAASFLFLKDN